MLLATRYKFHLEALSIRLGDIWPPSTWTDRSNHIEEENLSRSDEVRRFLK